jgi:hypothetical protein
MLASKWCLCLRPDWNKLVFRCSGVHPFDTWRWQRVTAERLQTNPNPKARTRLHMAAYRSQNAAVSGWGSLQPRSALARARCAERAQMTRSHDGISRASKDTVWRNAWTPFESKSRKKMVITLRHDSRNGVSNSKNGTKCVLAFPQICGPGTDSEVTARSG